MSTKVQEAFEKFWDRPTVDSYAQSELRENQQVAWNAAWSEAIRQAKVAVEGEGLAHDTVECELVDLGNECSDCGYENALTDAVKAITALDEGE